MQRNIGARSPTRRSTLSSALGLSSGLYLSCALFFTHTAQATSLFRFENRRENPGALRLLPEIDSLSTTDNYDYSGTKAAVPGLTSYKKMVLDLTGVYGVSRKLSVFGRISMATVSYETTSLTASGSGLTEQGLGANYRIWESEAGHRSDGGILRGKSIDAQFQLDLPIYDNVSARTSSPRQPLLGDGTLDLTFAGFGTMPLNQGGGTRLFLIGGLGLSIRNNSHSKAIPYQLQAVGLPEQSGFLYRLGFHGYKSLAANTGGAADFSPQSQTSPGNVDSRDAGGSLIVDALNSSYMHLRATLGYQWGVGDQVYLTYLMPMSGNSTAAITGILVGAQFRFPGQYTPSFTPTETTPAPANQAVRPKLSYDIAARVKQANDRLNLIKIDKGDIDGIEKGNVIDVYRTHPDGTQGDLVARGVVTGVSENEAVVNLRQYKKEVWVQPGFIARRIAPQKKP